MLIMMEQPIAILYGGVTIVNPVLGNKRVLSPVDLAVYPDRLSFTGKPPLGFREVTVDERRESIQEIYPLVVRSPWRWHPGLLGKHLIRVITKCANVYEGSPHYWFSFFAPPSEVVLEILASAGYPVDREPRIAGLLSGVDRKMPAKPAG